MLLRRAGQTIGEVASDVVSILNPSDVVGGMLARGGDFLLSGIRDLSISDVCRSPPANCKSCWPNQKPIQP